MEETASNIVSEITGSGQVQQVGEVASTLNNFGITATVLAVFIVVFIVVIGVVLLLIKRMNENINESNRKSNEAITALSKQMLDAVLGLVNAKNNLIEGVSGQEQHNQEEHQKEHKRIVSTYIDSSLAFKDAANTASAAIGCDRVAIYLFHNGNHSPYGYPFAKMSCIHEYTTRGSSTIRGYNHVNIPLYAFSTIVESLQKDNEYAISDMFKQGILGPNEQIFQFIMGASVKAMFILGIRDNDDELAAFSIAEFKEPQDFSIQETYQATKDALAAMNKSIRSIVINDKFRSDYTKQNRDSEEE